MRVLVKTDNHIEGSEALFERVESEVSATLERFGEQITRVDIFLSDVNAHKAGVDKRCLMEARLAGRPTVAVSHEADTLDEAIRGASDKLERLLDSTLGRRGKDHKGHTSFGGDQTL